MTVRRYRLDAAAELHGDVLIAGSPLKLFRLTSAGRTVVERLHAGEPVGDSPLIDKLIDAGAIHPVPDVVDTVFSAGDVTIVTPVFNDAPPNIDGAIVVDDGSASPIPGATVRLASNRGPSAARNAGLAHVTTPLVAFVDADVSLRVDWLESLLPHFDDDRVAVVAPRVTSVEHDGSTLQRYEQDRSPLDLGTLPARVRAGSRVSYVPAAALVCRVAPLREIGGFDESLRWGEDVDLVWRLDRSGWRVRYAPESTVEHRPRATWRAWWNQRVGYGGSSAQLAQHHPGALAPLRLSGWSVAAWMLGAAGRPISGAAIGVGSAAALVRKLPDVPAGAAFRLAARGNAHAGEQIGQAIRRAWWPILAVAATRSRTARRLLVASIVAARSPIRVADDVAFSVGVWRGMWTHRTVAPIVPEIAAWPGRGASAGAK